MRFVAVLLAVMGCALASSEDPFVDFALKFNKSYSRGSEMILRKEVFMQNYEKMLEHNARFENGEVSWSQHVHEDMDLTAEEWSAKRLGGLPRYDSSTVLEDSIDERIMKQLAALEGNTPKDFSWISRGAISSVKNQAQCGSCAAFAIMGALETCFFLQTGVMDDDLSEQHILDCAYNHYFTDSDGNWGAFGCDGAWPQAYVDWLVNHGPWNQEEASYPYTSGRTGDVTACSPKGNGFNTKARATGMHNKWYTDEEDMEALVNTHPVVISIQATDAWGGYHSGVLDDSTCCNQSTDPNCRYNLNHAVLVVGYGHDAPSGLDYWLIKNSWGTNWGENGFFKIKRGTGHCGVGTLHQTIPTCIKA